MAGENLIEVRKPEDLRPPKEWFEHCTRRLQEQGFSEERANRLCGWVFYHHLKPYPPEKGEKEKQVNKVMESLLTPNEIWRLAENLIERLGEDEVRRMDKRRLADEIRFFYRLDNPENVDRIIDTIYRILKKEKQETAEDILARIYSKISQGKELTEEERKILAAYLEGAREESEEKGDKTKEKEIEFVMEVMKMWQDDPEHKCPVCGKKMNTLGEAVDHLIYDHKVPPDKFRELLKQRELRDILARAMFNKPADELEEDELRRVHEVAVEIRRLMARQFGAEEIEEGEKESRLDEIKEEIKEMREKLKEIKKSAVRKLLKKIKKKKVKKKREEKPYTREARARKRAWLRARGR